MLAEILDTLQEGQTYSLQELAGILQTDMQSLKAQLEYLERHGYIKKVEMKPGCGSTCHGCKGCGHSLPYFIMWELTEL